MENVKEDFLSKNDAKTGFVRSLSTSRIARNTLFLYFRQILIMAVALYTVRAVLAALGAEDYGIYNVVAGVTVMFTFVNNAMASGTQRFLNFFLGKNDMERTNQVYSASLLIHFVVALMFVIVAESAGRWFVGRKLNIPDGRQDAAMTVYQITILTTVFSILRVPYYATVIAYEKMGFFAMLSIFEAFLKLAVVFLLHSSSFDRLVFYAFLLMMVALVITLVYKVYCNRMFPIANYRKLRDAGFVKEQLSFSGWSLFGAVANVANSQGTNIVLNMFTNVTMNAAMGIANQVNAAVYSFVSNFQTAFNPQIVKSWAEGNRKYFIDLICGASKVSFFLLTFLTVPLLVNCEFVLSVWLNDVPEYSVRFVQLILIWALIDSWNGPLWMAVHATGKIKKHEIIASVFTFSNLPIVILFFLFDARPEWVLGIRICVACAITVWRVFFLEKMIQISKCYFVFQVLFRSLSVFLSSLILTNMFAKVFTNGMLRLFVTCSLSIFFTLILIIFIGVSKYERHWCYRFIKNKIALMKKSGFL